MAYDPKNHHRRSIRLKGYDYSQSGAYFVTICAFRREEIFGEIVDEKMQLSKLGEIIQTEWFHSAEIRKEIQLFKDEFVLMPNHIHGIVWILPPESAGIDNLHIPEFVGADGIRPLRTANEDAYHDQGTRRVDGEGGRIDQGTCHVPLHRNPKSLASFVAGFKGAVTGRARREINAANIWQQNYHERVVRNENELKNFWEYIDTNPDRWQEDQLHPFAAPNPFNLD